MENDNLKSEREKLIFNSDIEKKLKCLELQRDRVMNYQPHQNDQDFLLPNHDADFYMVLLRRLYREIEKIAGTDSRVAHLKGQYKQLWPKIKIRDHFEHKVNVDELASIAPGIKIIRGVVINKTNPYIISGNQMWQLNDDHNTFIEMVQKMIKLYPFK